MSNDEQNPFPPQDASGEPSPDEPAPAGAEIPAGELGSATAPPASFVPPYASAPPPTPRRDFSSYPEDLRAPWNWGALIVFLLVGLVSLVLVSIFVGVGIGVVMAATGKDVTRAQLDAYPLKAILTALIQTMWFGFLMVFLAAFIRLHYRAPFWRTIGWRALRPKAIPPGVATLLSVLGGVGMAIGVSLLSYFVRAKTKLPIEDFLRDRQSALLLMGMAVLLAPLVEETVFRGFLYPVLARSFGVTGGILVTGLAFGLMHAPQLKGGPGLVVLLIGVGIVLTWVRARTGSVLASFLVHFSYNSFLFLGLFVSTRGLTQFPPPSP